MDALNELVEFVAEHGSQAARDHMLAASEKALDADVEWGPDGDPFNLWHLGDERLRTWLLDPGDGPYPGS